LIALLFWEPVGRLRYIVGSIWHDESNQQERLKRLFLCAGWQIWKRSVRTPLVVPLFNGHRFRAHPDCDCSSAVIYNRIPNYRCISFLRDHAAGGTFVDVGANVGMVSLLLADKFQNAWLFEPNPTAADRARENLRLNDLPFAVHEIALSDQNGYVEVENSGGVSSCNRTIDGFTSSVPTVTTPRVTFDKFFHDTANSSPAITALKIDVEGHENAVLRGMRGFLGAQRPRLVMFEYLQRTNIVETFEIFSGVDYKIVELTSTGPHIADVKVAPLQDLFACPKELAGEFLR
jgi:FkbM family methyltransferase